MGEFDNSIAKVVADDPELAEEVRGLVKAMIAETKRMLVHGTPQMKAALLSKGMAAVIQSVGDQDQSSKLNELRDSMEQMRESIRVQFDQ